MTEALWVLFEIYLAFQQWNKVKKSVKNWQNYRHEFGILFFETRCILKANEPTLMPIDASVPRAITWNNQLWGSRGQRSRSHETEVTFKGVYSDTTQLNSTDPVEQRTAKSVVFLFMTSRPTNWVNCCSRWRVEFSLVQFSWVVSL